MKDDTGSTVRTNRRLAAIMFTDIVGFSRQMGVDEPRMLRLLDVHNEVIRHAVAEHQGHVIKTMGDAFLVDFPSVVNAVQCAQAVQAQLHKHNAEKDKAEQIHVRIGIHLGVKVRISSDSMGSLRCPTLAGERKERSNEYGAESDHGEGGVVRAG